MTIGRIGMMNYSYRSYLSNLNSIGSSYQKLSSGYRVNRAADDAAGLGISERMRGQIRGLSQAYQNTQQGISLANTAEGALSSHTDKLQRMRELAVQASNGTYSDDDRAALNQEFQALSDELNRASSATNYNGTKLLDGSLGGQKGEAGVRAMGISRISTNNNTSLAGEAKFNITRENGNLSITATIGGETITNQINAGDTNTTFAFNGGNLRLDFNHSSDLKAGVMTGIGVTAGQINVGTQNAVSSSSTSAMQLQVGANGGADQRISLSIGDMSAVGLGVDQLDISSIDGANAAISALDRATNTVSQTRGIIGSVTNRMEHTLNNLGVSTENTVAAESSIRDLDMAWEAMQLTQKNLLMQASQSMMAQGLNLSRQNMLGLLMR